MLLLSELSIKVSKTRQGCLTSFHTLNSQFLSKISKHGKNAVVFMQKEKKHKAFHIFPFQGQNSTAIHTKLTWRRALWDDVLRLASCVASLCPEEEWTAVSAEKGCAELCCSPCSSLVTAHFSKHSSTGCVCLGFNPWLEADIGSFIKGCGLERAFVKL